MSELRRPDSAVWSTTNRGTSAAYDPPMARSSAVWQFSLRLIYAGLRLLDPILRA